MSDDLPLLRDPDAVELTGTLERVVFHNEENGYTVLRLLPDRALPVEAKVKGAPSRTVSRDPVTCVGHMVNPQVGVQLQVSGRWVNNARFGRQLAFDMAEEMLPATSEGIRLYLASGLIKGVGEEMAGRIVAAFGTDTIRVLDEEPERLLKIKGVGKKSFEKIKESWAEHRGIRDLLLFLQPHGITPAYAVRIYRAYGGEALNVVRENPYRLAMDIRGIGFVTADAAARKLGFAEDHPLRIQAGLLYVLQKATDDGNVFLPEEELLDQACQQLAVDRDLARQAVLALEQEERVVRESLDELPGRLPAVFREDGEEAEAPEVAVYLRRYHHYESKTAFYLHRLLHSPKAVRFAEPDALVEKVTESLSISLAPEQLEAVRTAARSKVMVLTGGPGTGKTTTVRGIVALFQKMGLNIVLAAPTGRAAKRMSELTGMEAQTVHRLLGMTWNEAAHQVTFQKTEKEPLEAEAVIVDEMSMVDLPLFAALLRALRPGTRLVMVGDADQLPSVGPGNVFSDLIRSGKVETVFLREVFRQAERSAIIRNAHAVNAGEPPRLQNDQGDFYFLCRRDAQRAVSTVVELCKTRLPEKMGIPVSDIQVLTPTRKGPAGTENLNRLLQEALNPPKPGQPEVRWGDRVYRPGDRVMQTRNDYDILWEREDGTVGSGVFNGDVGRIQAIDPAGEWLAIVYEDRKALYSLEMLSEIDLAYAQTVHKAQGSEYRCVVLCTMPSAPGLMVRGVLYTALTRARELLILVGDDAAVREMAANDRRARRYSGLRWRLAHFGEG